MCSVNPLPYSLTNVSLAVPAKLTQWCQDACRAAKMFSWFDYLYLITLEIPETVQLVTRCVATSITLY